MSLMEYYKKEVAPSLMSDLDIKNVMAVPRVEKVVLNVGIGTATPADRLVVKGSGTGSVLIDSWSSNTAYGVISLNGLNGLGSNFYSAPGKSLYINRQTGLNIHFRENNVDQMILSTGEIPIPTFPPVDNII